MSEMFDLVGMKFGDLTVVERDYEQPLGRRYWICKCTCGNYRTASTSELRKGEVTSCGCKKLENMSIAHKKYNDYVKHGDYCEVLTRNGESILISLEDYEKVKDICWSFNSRGYVVGLNHGTNVTMHRYIMEPEDDLLVDHYNGHRFDNRRENLRLCNKSQNIWNSSHGSIDGTRCIQYIDRLKKYRLRLYKDHKPYLDKVYNTLDEAVKARDENELAYKGEYRYEESQENSPKLPSDTVGDIEKSKSRKRNK